MDKSAKMALAAMLNSFPQGGANPDLLLRTFEQSLQEISDEVIIEVARRYTAGEVDGQNRTFAPSVAEFTQSARKLIELRQATRALPRLPAMAHVPLGAKQERMRRQYENRVILAEKVRHSEFLGMLRKRELPPGCEYVAILEIVYGRA